MLEKIREEFTVMLDELDWTDPQVSRYVGEDQGGVQCYAGRVGLDGSSGK